MHPFKNLQGLCKQLERGEITICIGKIAKGLSLLTEAVDGEI